MLERKNLVIAGKILKAHGIKGELSIRPDNPQLDISEIPYIVCSIDGIYVPFFIDAIRTKGNSTCIVKLNNIDSEKKAKSMSNLDFFCSKELMDELREEKDELLVFSWRELIGYRAEDVSVGILGEITDVDESTVNTLFCVTDVSGKEILLPANQDFIIDIQPDEKKIVLNLPEGLTDL